MSQLKVAVVVGVGTGLGSAIAHRFAREGFSVGLIARSAKTLANIQSDLENLGSKALSVNADVTDPVSLAAALDLIKLELAPPDILVYNAGIFKVNGILELSPEEFEYCWKVNCFGAFVATQQVLPAMLERGKGTILLTGATASLRGSARFSALAVGKFGLRALAQSLAREFGNQGIHVAHIVIDGMINTPNIRELFPQVEEDNLLSPDAIAETYWHLYKQEPSAWTLEMDIRPAVEKF